MVTRLATAWFDLRGSMRAVLDSRPGEGVLLSFALLSGFIWFLGRMASLWLGPEAAGMAQDALVARAGTEFVSSLIFRSLGLYLMAALGGAIARWFGGKGGWRDSRAALFWAMLVAAPVILVARLLALGLEGVPRAVVLSAASVVLAWAVAQCMAEAHGFRRGWAVLAVVAGLIFAVIATGYLLVRL